MTHMPIVKLLALTTALLAAQSAHAETINFDDLTPGIKPGNVYASKGIKFATCQSPNVVALNSVITLTECTQDFQILANNDAISLPNFAAAKGLGTKDVLMTFKEPVHYVELFSDDNPTETADIIRLLALQPTGKVNQFRVVAIHAGLDDRTGPAINNRLAVGSLTPFSAALFQTTTEAEGFDNLTFIAKPPRRDCAEGKFDPRCIVDIFVEPQWVPVGCEIIDCCPFCPGRFLDWTIRVEGDPFFSAVLFFDNLTPEVARGLIIAGNAKWLSPRRLEISGTGITTIKGLRADPNLMLPAAVSPRMSLERVTVVAPDRLAAPAKQKAQRSGTVVVTVEQMSGEQLIDKTQRIYQYSQ